jgi:RecB family endonuclease NucS
VVPLQQVPMDVPSESGAFTEDWLQDQLFQHPRLLPTEDIDPAYSQLIPVCRELNTPAGPIDMVYVTPQGRLVLTETKLWRNPEARRKVIAQILDYAKELAQWTYEDLSREVNRAPRASGAYSWSW